MYVDDLAYACIFLMENYNWDEIGFNFKFADLQAVIGVEQMKKLAWRDESFRKCIFPLKK